MDNQIKEKTLLESFLTLLNGIKGVSQDSSEEKEVEAVDVEMSEVKADEEIKETKVEEEVVNLSEEKKDYVSKEDFESYKTELASVLEKFVKSVSDEKEELTKEVAELSAQPSAEAIVHSPEVKEDKGAGFNLSSRRQKGTMDVVFESLSKFN